MKTVRAGNTNNIYSKSNLSSVQGPPSDPVVPMLLDAAEKVGVKVTENLKTFHFFFQVVGMSLTDFFCQSCHYLFLFQVCLHIEPFANRTVESVRNAVLYANQRYVGVTGYKI